MHSLVCQAAVHAAHRRVTVAAWSTIPPFVRQVTFDEKSPQELLQILNDVCAALDSSHDRDVRDEAPEVTGHRLLTFLSVLKFPLPADV